MVEFISKSDIKNMGDFTAYIQRLYDIQKKKGDFGSVLEPELKERRVKEIKQHRKENRDQVLKQRRRISSKVEIQEETPSSSSSSVTTTKTMTRLERLAQWKAERERKKIEAAKKMKPLFKFHSITTSIGLPDLENVNRQIKGKLFNNEKSQFAPVNHQFKPPANIKPIYFDNTNIDEPNKINVKSVGVKTRSQARRDIKDNMSGKSKSSKGLNRENNLLSSDIQPNQKNIQSVQNNTHQNRSQNSKIVLSRESSNKRKPSEKTPNKRTKKEQTPSVSNQVLESSIKTTQQVPEINKTNEKTPQRKLRNYNKTRQFSGNIEGTSEMTENIQAEISGDKGEIMERGNTYTITTRRKRKTLIILDNNDDNLKVNQSSAVPTVEGTPHKTAKTPKSTQSAKVNVVEEIVDGDHSKITKNGRSKRGNTDGNTMRKNRESTIINMNDGDNDTEITHSNEVINENKDERIDGTDSAEETFVKTTKTNKSNQKKQTPNKIRMTENHNVTTETQISDENEKTTSIRITRQKKRTTNIAKRGNRKSINDNSEMIENDEKTDVVNENDQTINENTNKLNESIKTPVKSSANHDENTVYISPFVTIARGKERARKEYANRQSRADFSPNDDASRYTSPKAAACYFTRLLKSEINRLEAVNDLWINYKEIENLSEEAQSMIDVAVGQSKLLIKEKFQQFQNLIETCKDPNNPQAIQCTDLHGFWDLLYIQITNINSRFNNLERMKSNNWNEFQPEIKKPQPKRNRTQKQKPIQATSILRQAIDAARKKKQQGSENVNVEIIEPTIVINAPLPTTSERKSIINSVQNCETKMKRNSSPGLTMMKVTRISKSFTTPNKGILKNNDAGKSTGKTKAVIFQNNSNNENNLNYSNQTTPSDKNDDTTFIRRSSRLSRSRLF